MIPASFKTILTRRYIKSLALGFIKRKQFSQLQAFCMFIGYQRSGHSFIGALLDAHPNAAMGMEVDALNLVKSGYRRNQIFYCLIRNSEIFTKKLNNIWTGYSYAVEGLYQGKYTDLKVLGDKKGGRSTLQLGEDFTLLTEFKEVIGLPLKVLHVMRNPLDNITTMIIRHLPDHKIPEREDFRDKIDLYFKKAEINSKLKKSGELEILDIYHEDFIKDPVSELTRILQFIGLDPLPEYIDLCSKKVYKEPHITRDQLSWPGELLDEIKDRAMQFPFLRKYFENGY
jgi:hypothetical protein